MTELEQIRAIVREYLALEAEYEPIAEGWAHLRLRGAARLGALRARLAAFAERGGGA